MRQRNRPPTVVGARGEVTFGGFLAADAKGFPASAMAKNNAGDWRNPERIRAWVAEVHEELTGAARNAHSASPARTQNTRDYPPPHSVVPP